MVLPRYCNAKYVNFNEGSYFGVIDIIGSMIKLDNPDVEDWFTFKYDLTREFTVMAEAYTQLLSLSLLDFNRLHIEFPEIYKKLIADAEVQLKKVLVLKMNAIKKCALQNEIYKNKYGQNLGSIKGNELLNNIQYQLKCYNYSFLYKKLLEDLEESCEDSLDESYDSEYSDNGLQ